MPFEHLERYALPDLRINYGPWEVKRPFNWGAVIANATPQIMAAIQSFGPDARRKRELQEAQLKFEQQKLDYLSANPDLAFGGKGYMSPLDEERTRGQIAYTAAATEALQNKGNKDYGFWPTGGGIPAIGGSGSTFNGTGVFRQPDFETASNP